MSKRPPIIKNVLRTGQKYVPVEDGCKVHFHFQTWKLGHQKVLIDDSRKIGNKKPMVLVIGKQFKLEVWETIVKMMAEGEVAKFRVHKRLLIAYPIISKTIREAGTKPARAHYCTMTFHSEGIGYPDLNELIHMPCDLEFIIEMLKIERPDEYEKDQWQLTNEERIQLVPEFKEKGNKLFREKLYDEAEAVYTQALAMCEQLMIRDRREDEDWKKFNKMRLPILLNYTQCKLLKGDYYAVIEHCNTVLEHDKENQKALYRRAKAHVGVWNPDAAEKDFRKLELLNPNMASIVDKELKNIKRLKREKNEQDKKNLKKLFVSDNNKSN